MNEAARDLLGWLLRRTRQSKSGQTRSTGLLKEAMADLRLDRVTARRALLALREEGEVEYKPDLDGEPLPGGLIRVRQPEVVEPALLKRWREVLATCSDDDRLFLEPMYGGLSGLSSDDLAAVAKGLLAMRAAGPAYGAPAFLLSARYLLGSSKLLSVFAPSDLRYFGIEMAQLASAKPYVIVAGPSAGEPVEAVILIENPHAFEAALAAGLARRHALIVTFGYGLTRRGDEFGRQLADLIGDQRDGLVPLLREGNPPPLPTLFAHAHLYFWGDLDPEGMRIYDRLRLRLPQLRLSALYGPMFDALRAGISHPYVEATAKFGQEPPRDGEQLADDAMSLFRACAERGLDQEWLDVAAHAHLAGQPLAPVA